MIPSSKHDFHSKLFEEKVFRLSAPDHMLWLQLRQEQCEVVTDRRKTHANEAFLDKGMPHRGAALPKLRCVDGHVFNSYL